MLLKRKGTKDDTPEVTQEQKKSEEPVTSEPIPTEEEPLDPFDQQVEQIFDLASICKTMAEDMYPVPEDCSTEMYLVLLKIQADCHMELFRAIVNNAANMVQAMQALGGQVPAPPGIVVAGAGPGQAASILLVRPPGGL